MTPPNSINLCESHSFYFKQAQPSLTTINPCKRISPIIYLQLFPGLQDDVKEGPEDQEGALHFQLQDQEHQR